MPGFAAGGEGRDAASAAQSAGRDPRDWRVIAELNRLDNPRFTVPGALLIPTGGT